MLAWSEEETRGEKKKKKAEKDSGCE